MRYGSIEVIQMPPVHAANLVANSGNIAYGVESIIGSSVTFIFVHVLRKTW